MKYIKYLFILAFCVSVVGSSSIVRAQSSGLTQSELNELIAFYEWALEAKFTPVQRDQFRSFVKPGENVAPSARRNLDAVLETWSNIKQASEEVRRKTRAEFLHGYLPQLKKSTDADDVFLLEIYKAAHGGRDTFTDLDEGRFNVADKSDLNLVSRGASANSLVGRWERYTGSGSITDGTGKTKYGNGKTFSFEFGPNGTLVYTVVEKTLSIMGCKIESTDQSSGNFIVNGELMSIKLGVGTSVGTDSCSKSGNYKKPLPATELTVKFQVKQTESVLRPDNPTLLCFDGGDGEACYEKIRK